MAKLIAISRVKNELDIIEPFIRHHAALVDKVIVLDDGSTDGTYEVLRVLQSEALPLVVLREPSIGYDQQSYMSRLLHMAVDLFGADWVVPLDADEFLEPSQSVSLHATLEDHELVVLSVGWSNFVWTPDCDRMDEINPVARLTARLPPRDDHTKVIVPAALVSGDGFELSQGNHALMHNGSPLPSTPVQGVQLCHFPIRSVEQYIGKIAIGYLQYRAFADRHPGHGFQYNEPFARLKRNESIGPEVMEAHSRRYSVLQETIIPNRHEIAPLRYAGGPLNCTPHRLQPLSNVLSYAEMLAERLVDEIAVTRELRAELDSLKSKPADVACVAREYLAGFRERRG